RHLPALQLRPDAGSAGTDVELSGRQPAAQERRPSLLSRGLRTRRGNRQGAVQALQRSFPQSFVRRREQHHECHGRRHERSSCQGGAPMAAVLTQPAADISRRAKLVTKSPYLAALQRRHFFVFDIVPNAMSLTVVPYHMFVAPVRVSDVVVFLLLWAVTG